MLLKENLGTFLRFYPVQFKGQFNVELNDNKGNVLVRKAPHYCTKEGTIAAAKEFQHTYELGKFRLDGWKLIKGFGYGEEK